jgi:hypothetical protein
LRENVVGHLPTLIELWLSDVTWAYFGIGCTQQILQTKPKLLKHIFGIL